MKTHTRDCKNPKHIITIDITEWYENLKRIAQNDVRTLEEQCRFFIKNAVENHSIVKQSYNYLHTQSFPNTDLILCNKSIPLTKSNSDVEANDNLTEWVETGINLSDTTTSVKR